jgi:hypothetical protein
MNVGPALLASAVLLAAAASATAAEMVDDGSRAQESSDLAAWSIYVINDNCPDYTWGLTEDQTRQAFADVVRGHLDEMNRTDKQSPDSQDRYNMAVTQEALCFAERYPQRKDELIERIKKGRVYVSPYLCNSLWGMTSIEQSLRLLYPARRLERDWRIPVIDVAEHIEEPSLPWGTATLLAGCGIRWLSNPFYGYDSTFGGLKCPPLFILEGPDGSRLRVVMDPWACGRYSYTQGAQVLREPKSVTTDWLPHLRGLGAAYLLKAVLASGTHGDISPGSGGQARGFADQIINHNAAPGLHYRLINAALPMFCRAVDEAEARSAFLRVERGSFGHSWDVWPVCLAKYAADMREGERQFLAAEALLALAGRNQPQFYVATRGDRERAEWCWAMLSDHAWNGADEKNQRHNADLRRKWSQEFLRLGRDLQGQGWVATGVRGGGDDVLLFNSLSAPRAGVVRIEPPAGMAAACDGKTYLDSQLVEEDGRRALYCASPVVAGFGLKALSLSAANAEPLPGAPAAAPGAAKPDRLRATATEVEGPFYRLAVDPATGGIASLVHKASGAELVAPRGGRILCQTVYRTAAKDGAWQEQTLTGVKSEVSALGPVLARLKITGAVAGITVVCYATVYAAVDRVDFDLRIAKPVATVQECLCQMFPIVRDGAVLRVEGPAAVVRPRPQPEGDLLPGADTRRFAVQGFVDAGPPSGPGVTLAPLDAFCLRLDLGALAMEAIGNDQNYKEVVKDQGGVREFRFRYVLRGRAGPYNQAEAVAWSRAAAAPFVSIVGRISGARLPEPVVVDPSRAIATALKPRDGDSSGECILRLWETAGKSGPMTIRAPGYKRAFRTDLLEREHGELKVDGGAVTIELPAYGLAAVRLVP